MKQVETNIDDTAASWGSNDSIQVEEDQTTDDNSLTFSFSPENKGPESGGNLKLVSVSSHVPDGAGEDHTFGVHLLQERNANTLLTCKTLLHL